MHEILKLALLAHIAPDANRPYKEIAAGLDALAVPRSTVGPSCNCGRDRALRAAATEDQADSAAALSRIPNQVRWFPPVADQSRPEDLTEVTMISHFANHSLSRDWVRHPHSAAPRPMARRARSQISVAISFAAGVLVSFVLFALCLWWAPLGWAVQ